MRFGFLQRKRLLYWGLPIVGVSALLLACLVYWMPSHARTYRFRITAGDARETRHQIVQVLREQAGDQGLDLEIQPTAGSEEALDRLDRGELDLALIQGGLRVEGHRNIRQVATLHVEPLHLLVKQELAAAVTANLAALEGKTVNLGVAGSGTHSLATEVLEFAGLVPATAERKRGYIVAEWPLKKLTAEPDRARLPDAVFLVSSLPSETAKALVNKHDFRLVPMAFGEAFSLDALAVKEPSESKPSRHGHVEKGRVGPATIPAYTYRVEPPVPAAPLPALGTRLLLVARADVDAHAVQRLVGAVYATEFATTSRPPLDAKLLELPPEFPWHDGTREYMARNTPIVSGVLMDSAHKGFAIFAAAASGLFVLWQWFRARSQFMRDRGFSKYINKIAFIEETATHVERDEIGGVAHLYELRDQLTAIKSEALARFTEGELSGHELMQGFLVQVNDVRDYVQGLIRRLEDAPAGNRRDRNPLES